METEYVFVYGSLKRGFRLHGLYLEGSRFIGEGVVEGFTLHNVNNAWYPGIARGDGAVQGEVFHIDAGKLAELDYVEDEGRLYDRTVAGVDMKDGRTLRAFIYVYRDKAKLGPVIQSGVWEDKGPR